MSAKAQSPFEIRGVHVLLAMLAFFGAVIAINVGFTIVAVRSFPGEDVRRSYLQGLHYNDTLAQRRAQEALGWRASAGFAAGGVLEITVLDREGNGVEGLAIEGALRRPADSHADEALLFQSVGSGRYRALAPPGLSEGAWDLRATAVRGAESFTLQRRLQWRSTPF